MTATTSPHNNLNTWHSGICVAKFESREEWHRWEKHQEMSRKRPEFFSHRVSVVWASLFPPRQHCSPKFESSFSAPPLSSGMCQAFLSTPSLPPEMTNKRSWRHQVQSHTRIHLQFFSASNYFWGEAKIWKLQNTWNFCQVGWKEEGDFSGSIPKNGTPPPIHRHTSGLSSDSGRPVGCLFWERKCWCAPLWEKHKLSNTFLHQFFLCIDVPFGPFVHVSEQQIHKESQKMQFFVHTSEQYFSWNRSFSSGKPDRQRCLFYRFWKTTPIQFSGNGIDED